MGYGGIFGLGCYSEIRKLDLVFFAGKIRGLIPYQPQYTKYQETAEDNISQCLHCDSQMRQVGNQP